jgi:serine/threonine protein kinase
MALPAHLTYDDLIKFRTRFCERFLQFGECNFHDKCQYSHNLIWRRRSPLKCSYEPKLCESIVVYYSTKNKRQTTNNCGMGKNCRFAHSREEVLYHPVIYKTLMCESSRCTRYYCPFAHSLAELQQSPEGLEYVRECMQSILVHQPQTGNSNTQKELFTDDSGDSENGEDEMLTCEQVFGGSPLLGMHQQQPLQQQPLQQQPLQQQGLLMMQQQMPQQARRKLSASSAPGSARMAFEGSGNAPDSAFAGHGNSWTVISPQLKIESIIRAHSPVVPSELCRAILQKMPQSVSVPSAMNGSKNVLLAKVLPITPSEDQIYVPLLNELQSLLRSEHKNILTLKKVHAGRNEKNEVVIVVVFDQCATSLLQVIHDGYRDVPAGGKVKSVAKKLNGGDGNVSQTAIQKTHELLVGLNRLHYIGISHLRIAPSNILVDNEVTFKLADFLGKYRLMCVLENGKREYAMPYLNELVAIWQAPELTKFLEKVVQEQQHQQSREDPQETSREESGFTLQQLKKCDIYSLGVCLFFAYTGQHPYGCIDQTDNSFLDSLPAVLDRSLDFQVINHSLISNIPLIADLVYRMIQNSPECRPDLNELLKHPLFLLMDVNLLLQWIINLPIETNSLFREFLADTGYLGIALDLTTTIKGTQSSSVAGSAVVDKVLGIVTSDPSILISLYDAWRMISNGTVTHELYVKEFSLLFKKQHLQYFNEFPVLKEYYRLNNLLTAGVKIPDNLKLVDLSSVAPQLNKQQRLINVEEQSSSNSISNPWLPPMPTPKPTRDLSWLPASIDSVTIIQLASKAIRNSEGNSYAEKVKKAAVLFEKFIRNGEYSSEERLYSLNDSDLDEDSVAKHIACIVEGENFSQRGN